MAEPENRDAPGSTLESCLLNRGENNLDFLRLLAATCVILSHSFALRGVAWEPLRQLTGYQSFGQLGVGIFFVMSGLLITRSWLQWPDAADFVCKRALRILPGFFCALLFAAFVVGPLATRLSTPAYFETARTYGYLRNAVIFYQQYTLPEVFTDAPFHAVNGSLWTLPSEVMCYGAVLAIGVARGLSRAVGGWIAAALIAYWFFGFFTAVHESPLPAKVLATPRQECWMWFLLGSLGYVYRDRLKFNRWGALIAATAYLVTLSTDEGYPFNIGYLVAFPSLTYVILYVAQVRAPSLSRWASHGDPSYGMYIYAFPVQQLIVHWLGREIGAGEMFALSMAATLPIAYASWHWVEKPMLGLARRIRKTPAPRDVTSAALAA